MKLFLIILMLMGSAEVNQDPDLSVIRGLYQKAAEQEWAAKKLLQLTRDYDTTKPVLFAYKGAAHMMMAKHVFNPISKMSHFNKGKKIFTATITNAPSNLELRFLRFAVQSEAPGFLGYKENIDEDKRILIKGVTNIKDDQLKEMIADYMLSSKEVSDVEKADLIKNNH